MSQRKLQTFRKKIKILEVVPNILKNGMIETKLQTFGSSCNRENNGMIETKCLL
jgi:hypothetical protein